MKEVVAIIRPNKIWATKEALAMLGFPAFTACKVLGRGKQKGLKGEVSFEVSTVLEKQDSGMKYVPKRLLSIVVNDADASLVVEIISRVNRTGEIGDGRIFVCPIEEAVKIRTRETGQSAIL